MEYTVEATVLRTARTRLVSDFSKQIRECLQVLNEDQIWWRPNESANSVGNLVLHLCGSTRFYVIDCIGGGITERDRPQEFAERKRISQSDLIAHLDQLVADCDAVFASLTPDDMTKTTERTGKTSSYAQILLHVLGHFGAHTGQILYITKMLSEGGINELWMKFRK